MLDFELDQ